MWLLGNGEHRNSVCKHRCPTKLENIGCISADNHTRMLEQNLPVLACCPEILVKPRKYILIIFTS